MRNDDRFTFSPRPVRCALRGACALALLPGLLLQGCSFIFVKTPPANYPEMQHVECTSSSAAPIIDTVIAGFETIRTGVALSADDADYHDYPISRGADIGFGLGLTALFAASAVYGYINTSKCSEVKQSVESAPPPVTPLPAPPAASLHAMCTYDAQCKGDRVCEGGHCVSPPPPSAQPPSTPAPEPAPAAPATPAPAAPGAAPPNAAPAPPATPPTANPQP